jgi:hypothetical protein
MLGALLALTLGGIVHYGGRLLALAVMLPLTLLQWLLAPGVTPQLDWRDRLVLRLIARGQQRTLALLGWFPQELDAHPAEGALRDAFAAEHGPESVFTEAETFQGWTFQPWLPLTRVYRLYGVQHRAAGVQISAGKYLTPWALGTGGPGGATEAEHV